MSRTFEVREMSVYDIETNGQLYRWDILLDNDEHFISRTLPIDLGDTKRFEGAKKKAIASLITEVCKQPVNVHSVHLNEIRGIKTRYFEVVV